MNSKRPLDFFFSPVTRMIPKTRILSAFLSDG
jgi:hypothetical protein